MERFGWFVTGLLIYGAYFGGICLIHYWVFGGSLPGGALGFFTAGLLAAEPYGWAMRKAAPPSEEGA